MARNFVLILDNKTTHSHLFGARKLNRVTNTWSPSVTRCVICNLTTQELFAAANTEPHREGIKANR